MLLKLLMWLPPRPPKPTTATRMSLLSPGTCAQSLAGKLKPAVVSRDVLRKERRVSFMVVLSRFLGHNVGRAVGTGEEFVGLVVVEEPLRLRVHSQRHTQRDFVLRNVHVVGRQVLGHPA